MNMAEAARRFRVGRASAYRWLQTVNGCFSLGLVLAILSVLPLSAPAVADDATLLQQSTIARIEAFVEHFRKTGNFKSRVADLQQEEAELTASNRAFAARSDWSAAARDEVETIARLYPGRAKVAKEPLAREAEVKVWVGGYDIVHLYGPRQVRRDRAAAVLSPAWRRRSGGRSADRRRDVRPAARPGAPTPRALDERAATAEGSGRRTRRPSTSVAAMG